MKKLVRFTILIPFLLQPGCAGFGQKLKSWMGGESNEAAKAKPRLMKFSDNSNVKKGPDRNYKRVTKKKLEDQSQLNSRSGSLWVMEGQGAYLFAQNSVRMIGDSLVVKLDGEARNQVTGKVDVIKKLIDRLENRRRLASIEAAKEKAKAEGKKTPTRPTPSPSPTSAKENGPSNDNFNVKVVPTRIVERLLDGNYRVKGSQPFMIGKREYKVIVTGIIKSEDYNDEGVSANQLLDPKFDIVSTRRSMTQ